MIFPLEYAEFVAEPRKGGAGSRRPASAGRRMLAATVLAAALALIGWVVAGRPAAAQTGGAAGALVTTEWLEKNLDGPKLRVIEVSVEPGLYERGHVPGGQNVVWHTDLVETTDRDIARPEKFQALARKLGIDRDTTVVLYVRGHPQPAPANAGAHLGRCRGHENPEAVKGWSLRSSCLELHTAAPRARARSSTVACAASGSIVPPSA